MSLYFLDKKGLISHLSIEYKLRFHRTESTFILNFIKEKVKQRIKAGNNIQKRFNKIVHSNSLTKEN